MNESYYIILDMEKITTEDNLDTGTLVDVEMVDGQLQKVERNVILGIQRRESIGGFDTEAARKSFIKSSQGDSIPAYTWDKNLKKMVPANNAARLVEEAKKRK